MRHISKIGIELEGGWRTPPPSKIYYDGSIDIDAPHYGEVCSDPLGLDEALQWLDVNYPNYVNGTCGMHVHFSLHDDLLYSRLMDQEFYSYFLSRIEAWGRIANVENRHFWDRLEGRNHYCDREFRPDRQVWHTDKRQDRYCHLNYCHALHGTVECRLFPVFRSKMLAASAIRELVAIVEEYLDSYNPIEDIAIEVEDDELTVTEEDVITI